MMSRKMVVVSVLAITAVGLLTYYSASRIGFVNLDWYHMELVAKFDLPEYLVRYFDPRMQSWYRPLFGTFFLVVYTLFGVEPGAYYFARVLVHLANGVFLFAIVWRISLKWRLAFVAALLYVGLPVYSKAVYWIAAPDPLAMFFYLMALWFWLAYLETGKLLLYGLTFGAFITALLTKETSVTLPVVLFLVDRLLLCIKVSRSVLAYRYLPLVVALLPYLATEYIIQRSGAFVQMAGYGFGSHVVANLIGSLAALAFPWAWDAPERYVWLLVVAIVFLLVMIVKRSAMLAFLGIVAIINLVPVVGFHLPWFEMRYLYPAAMVAAILLALLFEVGWRMTGQRRWYGVLAAGSATLLVFANYLGVSGGVASWNEIARQRGVAFRNIVRNHPTFPEDTNLYFIDTFNVPLYDLSVMFLLRYGKSVTVKGVADNQVAQLQDHRVSCVYYFDPTGQPIEVAVDKEARTRASLSLPVDFAIPIRLEAYEAPRTQVKPGEVLVMLLYWRATGKIDRDYTVFTHLVSESGEMVAGYDSQPQKGNSPTSTWGPNQFIVHPAMIPITPDIPAKSSYRLEVGLYYVPTMERVSMVDARGQPIGDQVVIESFSVVD